MAFTFTKRKKGWTRLLALDAEFVKETNQLIQDTLGLYQSAGASPRIGHVWDCENAGDFLCGFFVGEMVGSALSAFQYRFKREPTPEEHLEIVSLVEAHASRIKSFFAQFN